MKRARLFFLALLTMAIGVGGCGTKSESVKDAKTNIVVAYLAEAERQSETDDQRQEIEKALRDMLTLSPGELRKRRYADYQGNPQKWSVTTLLTRYFVPDSLFQIEEDRFYEDVSDSTAQEITRRQLEALLAGRQIFWDNSR